jgi:hypothetical protein
MKVGVRPQKKMTSEPSFSLLDEKGMLPPRRELLFYLAIAAVFSSVFIFSMAYRKAVRVHDGFIIIPHSQILLRVD